MARSSSFRSLAALYLRAGNLTFGGGDVITATLQRELVHVRGWLTMDQYGLAQSLAKITPGTGNLAFTAGRSGPGPNGIYLVSVGYLVAGIPGACVAWLAMITPAFLAIPLVRLVGARADNPRLLGAIHASTAASAGLVLAANVPMARDALTNGSLVAIAIVSFGVFSLTRIDSVWVILVAALLGLLGATLIH